MPKPLLPVAGRPLLWYALRTVVGPGLLPPVVVVCYKAELIRAYFEGEHATFLEVPPESIAESMLRVASMDQSPMFLCLSSDVLMQQAEIRGLVREAGSTGESTAYLTRMPETGHKRWEFIVQDGRLTDVAIQEHQTHWERVGMVLSREDLLFLATSLERPVSEQHSPLARLGYNAGWTMILKALADAGRPVRARTVAASVVNVNTPRDIKRAEAFVNSFGDGMREGDDSVA